MRQHGKDLAVGALFDDDAGSSSGSVYVYYGSATGIDGSSGSAAVKTEETEVLMELFGESTLHRTDIFLAT